MFCYFSTCVQYSASWSCSKPHSVGRETSRTRVNIFQPSINWLADVWVWKRDTFWFTPIADCFARPAPSVPIPLDFAVFLFMFCRWGTTVWNVRIEHFNLDSASWGSQVKAKHVEVRTGLRGRGWLETFLFALPINNPVNAKEWKTPLITFRVAPTLWGEVWLYFTLSRAVSTLKSPGENHSKRHQLHA